MAICSTCLREFTPKRKNLRHCSTACSERMLGRSKPRARRGTTAERGYGSPHRRLRAELAKDVQAGKAYCWRCGGWIPPDTPGQPTGWHVGHDDWDRSIVRGPEHAGRCNLRHAAIKVNRMRSQSSFTSSAPRIASGRNRKPGSERDSSITA